MRDPDALLVRAGVRGDPERDQHFLIDDRVLDRLPGYLPDSADTDHVLEIGGGTGALTDRLLDVADRVTVIERDPGLATFLTDEFADEIEAGSLTVIEGDALEVPLPDFTASVSNLPYGVSSEIAFRLLPEKRPLVLMFQQEFAERMAAEPGTDEYGRLSVTAGHYADVEVVEPVPKEAFSPPPAVESAVVRTTPREPPYEVPDDELFMRLVRAVFTQRRKTMRNAVRNTTHISGIEDAEAVVEAAGEDLMSKRAGNVPPEAFARLAAIAAEVDG
ncbi:ribosome biogenesis protein KsgA, 16S rRNA-methylating [Natronomonas pharaonis DSM 2160]|uniref:Probable ribosomal RNA small subunit methyltransferase A n=1 Tax=Natronomonas pharaonis (strain ATCC 35678 / DSM 2160 / CIP 103997 / JCM 8858 / NBRC 14720 / NCIMB 2260 / Gabara) TaxID=348780 RepID=RSMA_NATPD|nr:16S ribosomal RNA methyltransferase A [Natronomonas pharaonis]Q3IPM0.1 RecName: Full=Probable ribosomal RNA small subunit methyltransferase A; AltName: Full=16S rRNA dimethyladenosine transferase; AltName: Full=16S rRNA dimethylase; AltName: Full=S-adenosylmethionine-6-N',N'-adenosyl(rRNA) dimethyltransferase [Natronomonas pharaonis DSM 2160]CAI49930.1 ribosome biogenesis protein KsgA, 16S rRNA-methylating [Natronomonas pharaonis DSM 2160]